MLTKGKTHEEFLVIPNYACKHWTQPFWNQIILPSRGTWIRRMLCMTYLNMKVSLWMVFSYPICIWGTLYHLHFQYYLSLPNTVIMFLCSEDSHGPESSKNSTSGEKKKTFPEFKQGDTWFGEYTNYCKQNLFQVYKLMPDPKSNIPFSLLVVLLIVGIPQCQLGHIKKC